MSDHLPHERVVFARELRRVRQQTGLTLVALAERTTASKSSWQRYLSGAHLPPRGVVRELCELAGRKPGPLLALWELAEASRHRRQPPTESRERPAAADAGDVPEVPPTPPEPAQDVSESTAPAPEKARTEPVRDRSVPALRLPAAALSALLALAVVGVALLIWSDRKPEGLKPGCRGADCTGKRSQPNACGIDGSAPLTVAEREFDDRTRVDIRYSEGCEASWARIWFGEIGDRLEVSAPGQETQSVRIADKYDAEGYLSTPMVGGGPGGVRACLVSARADDRRCFSST